MSGKKLVKKVAQGFENLQSFQWESLDEVLPHVDGDLDQGNGNRKGEETKRKMKGILKEEFKFS